MRLSRLRTGHASYKSTLELKIVTKKQCVLGPPFISSWPCRSLGCNTGPIASAYLTYARAVRGVWSGVGCLAGHVTQSSNRLADFGVPRPVHGLGHSRIPQRQFLGPHRLRAYSLVSVLKFFFTVSGFHSLVSLKHCQQ